MLRCSSWLTGLMSNHCADMYKTISQHQQQGIGATSQRRRDELIRRLEDKGITNRYVLQAMSRTPRHLFLDEAMAHRAYEDCSLPIGHGQTISQPYMVARMTEQVIQSENPQQWPGRVLEVGTGSGYQSAVLSHLVKEVYSVERILALHKQVKQLLPQLAMHNIKLRHTDGSWGWEQYAPYNAVIVTAAAEALPDSLLSQLTIGGHLIIPVGKEKGQQLIRVKRVDEYKFEKTVLEDVHFVPFLSGRG